MAKQMKGKVEGMSFKQKPFMTKHGEKRKVGIKLVDNEQWYNWNFVPVDLPEDKKPKRGDHVQFMYDVGEYEDKDGNMRDTYDVKYHELEITGTVTPPSSPVASDSSNIKGEMGGVYSKSASTDGNNSQDGVKIGHAITNAVNILGKIQFVSEREDYFVNLRALAKDILKLGELLNREGVSNIVNQNTTNPTSGTGGQSRPKAPLSSYPSHQQEDLQKKGDEKSKKENANDSQAAKNFDNFDDDIPF